MLDIIITQEATWFGKTTERTDHYSIKDTRDAVNEIKDFLRRSVDAGELNWFIFETADGFQIDAYRKGMN